MAIRNGVLCGGGVGGWGGWEVCISEGQGHSGIYLRHSTQPKCTSLDYLRGEVVASVRQGVPLWFVADGENYELNVRRFTNLDEALAFAEHLLGVNGEVPA